MWWGKWLDLPEDESSEMLLRDFVIKLPLISLLLPTLFSVSPRHVCSQRVPVYMELRSVHLISLEFPSLQILFQ